MPSSTALDALAAELGISAAIDAAMRDADETQADCFAKAIVTERDRRDALLNDAIENGLRIIPRLVRPAVKKILFG